MILLRLKKAQPVSTKPKPQSEEVESRAPMINPTEKLPARRGRPPKVRPVVQTAQIGDPSHPDHSDHDTGPKHPACDRASDNQPMQKSTAANKPTGKRGRPRKEAAEANRLNFVSAPLNDSDWERITAREAANWKSHWNIEKEKYAVTRKNQHAQSASQPAQSVIGKEDQPHQMASQPAPRKGAGGPLAARPTRVGLRRSSRGTTGV
ncbi:hypothetical protein PtB15_4B577 [Puccinia triticina]|nr:hypothetical protein PtB15_4B577 [Puccinia triticina]